MRSASAPGAAIAYWAGVFIVGFVLGTARTLWLVPVWGELPAVLVELPFMLLASWWWAARVLAWMRLPSRAAAGACGVLALAVLLASEALLATAIAGQSGSDWLQAMLRPAGLAGLAGQLAFAAFPAWRWQP